MYNPSMKKFAASLLIPSLFSTPTLAEVTEYDFEIIIFEDTSNRYANSEQWQYELPEAITELELRSPDEAQRNPGTRNNENALANITKIKSIGLDKYAKKLDSRKRYNVLVHKAWRQAGLADNEAIDIPIDSRTLTSTGGTIPAGDKNNIEGTIKIVLGRYLHIYTDMIYRQPNENYNPAMIGEAAQPYKQFPIKSHRRMRSKELHYLDHPMVGILVMAMPVKKEKEET